jgi:hypothetical protein
VFAGLIIGANNSNVMDLAKIKHSHVLLISDVNVTQAVRSRQ